MRDFKRMWRSLGRRRNKADLYIFPTMLTTCDFNEKNYCLLRCSVKVSPYTQGGCNSRNVFIDLVARKRARISHILLLLIKRRHRIVSPKLENEPEKILYFVYASVTSGMFTGSRCTWPIYYTNENHRCWAYAILAKWYRRALVYIPVLSAMFNRP